MSETRWQWGNTCNGATEKAQPNQDEATQPVHSYLISILILQWVTDICQVRSPQERHIPGARTGGRKPAAASLGPPTTCLPCLCTHHQAWLPPRWRWGAAGSRILTCRERGQRGLGIREQDPDLHREGAWHAACRCSVQGNQSTDVLQQTCHGCGAAPHGACTPAAAHASPLAAAPAPAPAPWPAAAGGAHPPGTAAAAAAAAPSRRVLPRRRC